MPTGLSDTKAMLSILRSLGAKIEFNERNKEILVNTDGVGRVEPCLEEMRKIRGGFFVIGPLLARFGEAVVGLPGGCDIGERPVDLHVRGLRALGATVEISYVFFFNFNCVMFSLKIVLIVFIDFSWNIIVHHMFR